MPFINGVISVFVSFKLKDSPGNQSLFAILGACASCYSRSGNYEKCSPDANPRLYLSMALGITFPINVIIGIPFYYAIIQMMSQKKFNLSLSELNYLSGRRL